MSEKKLLKEYLEAKGEEEQLSVKLALASKKVERTKEALMEHLFENEQESTGKYVGLGSATLSKPRIFASCKEEDKPKLFDYLKKEGREDLCKVSVHSGSLSSFISEKFEKKEKVPDFINHYVKHNVKLNAYKK